MMKMQVFFNGWDNLEDLNKYSEYEVARKMINVIEKENNKNKGTKLTLIKGGE